MQLTENELDLIRDRTLEKFKWFAQTFITHFGSFDRYCPQFHDPLCDFLQYAPSPDKLVILPRNTLKTTICTILHPLWKVTKDTRRRFLLAGNSETNSRNNQTAIMGIAEGNRMYGALYPDRIPQFKDVRWSASCCEFQRPFKHPNGTFEAVGVGTNITGRRPTDLTEDDTVYPKKDQMTQEEMMPTRDDVQKAVGFHKLTLPLIDNPREGERTCVLTRWASYDLANYIIENELVENGGRYSVYDMPAKNEQGEPNYPSFYDEDTLRAIKGGMGSFMFEMLYMNNPLASEHMKIRPEWLRYFYEDDDGNFRAAQAYGPSEEGKGTVGPPCLKDEIVCEAHEGRRLITVDPADPPGEKSAQQCFSVGVSACNTSRGLFIEEYVRGKWTDVQLAKKTFVMADKRSVTRIKIEKDRYPHMKNVFKVEGRKRAGKRYSIEDCHTKGRKKDDDRIMKIAALAEEGLLWIKVGMNEFEHECYTYPRGKTVDILDATAWQIVDEFKLPDKASVQETVEKAKEGEMSFEKVLASLSMDNKYPIGPPKVSSRRWTGSPRSPSLYRNVR